MRQRTEPQGRRKTEKNNAVSDAPNPNPAMPTASSNTVQRIFWRTVLVVAALALVVIGAGVWYASTPQFENFVRQKVVAELGRATGGRVELGAFHWRLLHLDFTAEDLTIHGTEGPGQAPYVHIDRLYVKAKIISFFESRIGLRYLEADRPEVHLIVYPDGTTSQPHPKVPEKNNKPVLDTIFDLALNRAVIRDGVAKVNERAIPLNASGNDVDVSVTYIPAMGLKGHERYLGNVHVEDLTVQQGKDSAVHSILDAQVELGRNEVTLQGFRLQSGSSHLDAQGSLVNFANPAWKFQAKGAVELAEFEALSDVPGLNQGQVQLDVNGNGSTTKFVVDGTSRVQGASYHAGSIHLAGVNANAKLHLTRDELDITDAHAMLAKGGFIDGSMRITHWMQPQPTPTVEAQGASAKAAKGEVQRGTVTAQLHGIALASIMAVVAPPHYTELGFDTEASGTATADWTGDADDFVAAAKVSLMPPLKPTAGRVPMYGTVDAEYSNANGSVAIHTLDVHTPGSEVRVSGALGVYPITRVSNLDVTVTSSNVAEFDRTLTTLGVASKGRTGLKALPVSLHGKMAFTGTLTDSILSPDVKGHVNASDFDLTVTVPSAGNGAEAEQAVEHMIHWDSIVADAEYSRERITVTQAELMHGSAVVHLSGELEAHETSPRRMEFDEHSGVRANVNVEDANIEDLLAMAGENLPVTGTLNLRAHAGGTMDNLNGGGQLSVTGGTAYGETYKSLTTDLNFTGREIGATDLVFQKDGGSVTGDGGYNLVTHAFHFEAQGSGFELAQIHHLQNDRHMLNGSVSFEAEASGTLPSPSIQARLYATNVNLDNAVKGSLEAAVHTQGDILVADANGTFGSAQIQLHGQTQLGGEYPSKAELVLANFNVDPVLDALNVQGIRTHSSIAATVKLNGPLREPRRINGDFAIRQLSVSLAGVGLQSDGPIHATLLDGRLHLDMLHIMGEDTNLHAHGSIGLLTETHDLDLEANGSVNMRLVQTLDSDLSASGHVDFTVKSNGTFDHPGLTGNVHFSDVAMALQDFPNGLSQMNGTLQFDQDRLDVKSLTAVSGGGKLTLGGFVTYQQGLYGDLTATAKDVRIRYPQGVSSMANAKLRLQGTQKSSLLSGNVTITRFVVGSGLDLTSFSAATSQIALPLDQNAPSNHVRLDVHVVSAPQLDFQNSYAKLAGDVDLRVRGTLAQPTILGHVSITEGSATFAGTKYELQHGDIYFSNPIRIDPVIDLSATARVEDYDITVGLTGTVSNPMPTFRSEPPLSEQDIFSLLAMGRTQEEQQIYSTMQSQAGVNSTADALLGGALNATVSSRIQKLFGGGSVKIDPTFVEGTGNSTARITVEQQISKNATLTYATNVNSTAQQLIQGQINLTQNVSLVAVRDEAGVFSMLIKLRRRYR